VQRSPALHTPALALLAGLTVAGAALLAGSSTRNLTAGRPVNGPSLNH
jgi:hypothetical protein